MIVPVLLAVLALGALIVHPSDPAPKGFPTWDEELVVELSDVYHTFSAAIAQQYLAVCIIHPFV